MDAPARRDALSPAERQSRDEIVRLSRDDLVTSVEAYRARFRSWRMRVPILGFLGGIASGPTLITIGSAASWPEALDPYFFFLGWAIAIPFAVWGSRMERRVRADLQWYCSHCNAPMIDPDRKGSLVRAETAIASGRCPVCGEALFPDET